MSFQTFCPLLDGKVRAAAGGILEDHVALVPDTLVDLAEYIGAAGG